MAFDTTSPLLETKFGNKYVLVAIDHYSKWCKAKTIVNHDVETIAKFLKDEVIYRFGVPKYILIDNGLEWFADFDQLCKNYGIYINTLYLNGQGAMGWWKGLSRLSNMDLQFCLPTLSMYPKLG